MANPDGDSRGIIDISGGREIVVAGKQFLCPSHGEGGPASRPEPVKIGLNGDPGYAGVVRGNANASDPGVKVIAA
ncbi:MAG: hypothetical protein JWP83_1458 [Mycobacterium sp.]|jgi:hypothetical protein|uniref:hypothetical protein n=1 Tax=Mycobacterium sp. TaxID=1785 RepID=UPI00260196B2|nr:hypothetical protein [Mycobacterium sp.]MCW2660306.1 hypothetical protein [Mycobacterium sp.]